MARRERRERLAVDDGIVGEDRRHAPRVGRRIDAEHVHDPRAARALAVLGGEHRAAGGDPRRPDRRDARVGVGLCREQAGVHAVAERAAARIVRRATQPLDLGAEAGCVQALDERRGGGAIGDDGHVDGPGVVRRELPADDLRVRDTRRERVDRSRLAQRRRAERKALRGAGRGWRAEDERDERGGCCEAARRGGCCGHAANVGRAAGVDVAERLQRASDCYRPHGR